MAVNNIEYTRLIEVAYKVIDNVVFVTVTATADNSPVPDGAICADKLVIKPPCVICGMLVRSNDCITVEPGMSAGNQYWTGSVGVYTINTRR